jgi:Leucine-rich repeat (LRR) protein
MKTIITLIALASTATFSWMELRETDSIVIEEEIQRARQESGVDLAQLKRLIISGKELEKLDRLKVVTAMEDLNLSDNQIENLMPLGQLDNLIVLDLSKNRISDLSPLTGLAKLRYLNLNQNQVASLEPLRSMPELEGLILVGNNHVDLSPLTGMKNLRSLYLEPGPNLSQADLDRIQEELPNCMITVTASTE